MFRLCVTITICELWQMNEEMYTLRKSDEYVAIQFDTGHIHVHTAERMGPVATRTTTMCSKDILNASRAHSHLNFELSNWCHVWTGPWSAISSNVSPFRIAGTTVPVISVKYVKMATCWLLTKVDAIPAKFAPAPSQSPQISKPGFPCSCSKNVVCWQAVC